MNAYLFTASIDQSQFRPSPGDDTAGNTLQTWDSCVSLIVCDDSADKAQEQFEAWLHHTPEGQNPIQTEIKRLVAAQFMEQLLTESGSEPIDWMRISERVEATLQSAEGDNHDPGYWADANQLIRPEKLGPDLESLQRDLPEDIRSGLNWSADQQFVFIVSVLSRPSPAAIPAAEPEFGCDENPSEAEGAAWDAAEASLPELAAKDVAALVQARNSVVAAWLWRKFAEVTELAANDIDVDPWCAVIGPEAEQDQPS